MRLFQISGALSYSHSSLGVFSRVAAAAHAQVDHQHYLLFQTLLNHSTIGHRRRHSSPGILEAGGVFSDITEHKHMACALVQDPKTHEYLHLGRILPIPLPTLRGRLASQ